jgi:type I restriction enzyme S subunit
LIRFRFAHDAVTARFVYTFFKSSFGQDLLGLGTTRVAQPNVNATAIKAMPLPLPPLAEQRRIVAKVEHLMKLCDDLEAKLHRAETTAAKLAKAVVAEMLGV